MCVLNLTYFGTQYVCYAIQNVKLLLDYAYYIGTNIQFPKLDQIYVYCKQILRKVL